MDESSIEEYRDFVDTYGHLFDALVQGDWTRRQARFRLRALYPELSREMIERALFDDRWAFVNHSEEPPGSTMTAVALWLAVNDLFDLGTDRVHAVSHVDPITLQTISDFFALNDVAPEVAAEIYGRIGATLRFLTQYPHTSVTRAEYSDFRLDPPESLRRLDEGEGTWPPTAQEVAERLGEGSWDRALLAVGLRPLSREIEHDPEFSEARFRSIIADFLAYCVRNDRQPQAIFYGRWSTMAEGVQRPTLASIRHRYGSWLRALSRGRELIGAGEAISEDPRRRGWSGPWLTAEQRASADTAGAWSPQRWTDRGIGVVEHVQEEAIGDESAWQDLEEELRSALAGLPWNHFLTVEYETGNTGGDFPYAQAFTGPAGVAVRLVSEDYLPAFAWPIDEDYLVETGWEAPGEEQPNWARTRLAVEEAAGAVVEGLRYGRGCPDPYRFRWGSGTVTDARDAAPSAPQPPARGAGADRSTKA
jgi:hypothetical protein